MVDSVRNRVMIEPKYDGFTFDIKHRAQYQKQATNRVCQYLEDFEEWYSAF